MRVESLGPYRIVDRNGQITSVEPFAYLKSKLEAIARRLPQIRIDDAATIELQAVKLKSMRCSANVYDLPGNAHDAFCIARRRLTRNPAIWRGFKALIMCKSVYSIEGFHTFHTFPTSSGPGLRVGFPGSQPAGQASLPSVARTC